MTAGIVHAPPVGVHHVVVMGVSGCGKSTVGALLAASLGAEFLDGDSLHPPSNVEKMAAGIPLDDADRQPWLEEIGRRFAAASDMPLVIACSALKRSYRDLIGAGAADARFVHLHGTAELLAARMAARPGHFMPTSLLTSQLQTLEPLQADEAGVVLDIAETPIELAVQAGRWLAGHPVGVRSA